VMSTEQRQELAAMLRGGKAEKEIPFAQPGSLTRVYAVASGKGGVGKSSVTVNLAAALAADGLKVAVVDADIYGHSVPRMLGVDGRPTQVENMIMPPSAHGVKVISIGMFTPGNAPVVWRGPMLHRALQQFLGDVYWGDLDSLSPGTELPRITSYLATYNMVAAPVVDETDHLLGAVTVDDVLDHILPEDWRESALHGGIGEDHPEDPERLDPGHLDAPDHSSYHRSDDAQEVAADGQ
jgi:hypothetical protein